MARGSATWRRVKFGEIAQCVNDRVDDPKAAGVDRYVGLEHLESESLSIRRWGTPDDVESTKLRFKPGDIIFGKRRAYQRKLAVANFEGICSAHAMVLRAKPDAVLPEFLPSFMKSDLFMERAIAISVGSLSPTINWKTLAAEEFTLPPLETQRHMVELFRRSEEARDGIRRVVASLDAVRESAAESVFMGPTTVTLGELLHEITVGIVVQPASLYDDTPGSPPTLMAENVVDGRLSTRVIQRLRRDAHEAHAKSRVYAGDVVVTRRGVNAGRAAAVGELHEGWTAVDLLILRPRSDVVPEVLAWYINSSCAQRTVRNYTSGSAIPFISAKRFSLMPCPAMTSHQQQEALGILTNIRTAELAVRKRNELTLNLSRQVLAATLGG